MMGEWEPQMNTPKRRFPLSLTLPHQGGGNKPASLVARLRARDSERLRRYQDLLDFYEGVHFPRDRRGRTSLVVNYARAVADKGISYLFGRGVHFAVPADAEELAATDGQGTVDARVSTAQAREAERLLNRIAE